MTNPIRVTVWNEYRHEKSKDNVAAIYPEGIHAAIADFLGDTGFSVRTATLDEPQHGLTGAVLEQTDVLTWWGHMAHDEVDDAIVEQVHAHVLDGMGLIVLHSGHFSKIFKRLMGTSCNLWWREADEKERLWVIEPGHPIAAGLPPSFEIPKAEMYGEHFGIPQPETLVFVSWFAGGEVFRSGATFRRGRGKIFYFRPGHETYPIYYQDEVQRVIINAVQWCAPDTITPIQYGNRKEPLEDLG